MATGNEKLYNYNNNAYSEKGYPFSGELRLQASYSTDAYNTSEYQSIVYVAITLKHLAIDWSYLSGRDISVYWNDDLIATFAPPSLHFNSDASQVSSMGTAAFVVQHDKTTGACTGELKVEWDTGSLNYTVDGETINITELGCKATVSPEIIHEGAILSDSLSINGKNFISVCKEDGIKVARAEVNKKSVITMDGTEWAKEKKRHTISVSLMDMSSSQYSEYAAYLQTNPAQVIYKDDEDGLTKTGTFYITNIKQTKHKAITGVTYLKDISFDLSEMTAN